MRDAEAQRDMESRKCVEAQKGMKRFEKKAKDVEVELVETIRQGKSLYDQIDKHMSEGRKLRQLYEEAVSTNKILTALIIIPSLSIALRIHVTHIQEINVIRLEGPYG